MNPTIPQCSGICAALVALVCGLWGCGSSAKTPIVEAGGSTLDAVVSSLDAGGPSVDAGVDSGTIDAPTCPASCDDKNDCTIDSCDPNTFQCVHTVVADGQSCEDGSPCTIHDVCQGGLCYSGPNKTCGASDQCHEAGVCSPRTGECSNPNSANGKSCDDGLKCTTADQCSSGVCQGTPFCPSFAACDPTTGICDGSVFPTALSEQLCENGSGPTNSNGLVRTPDGQIFAVGTFFNTTNLGSGPVATVSPSDPSNSAIFMAKLDPSTDKATWTKTFLGSKTQGITGVAVNGSGQLGLLGSFSGNITVGDTLLEQSGAAEWYILGASSTDGSGQWARRVGFSTSKVQSTGLSGIAGDPQGATFVLCGTANQSGTDLSPSLQGNAQWQGGTDIVLAGLDGATGDTLWAAQVGGNNDETCAGVAVDGQSNTYVVGSYRFASVVRLGNLAPLPTVNDPKAVGLFVAKLGRQSPFGVADAGAEDSSGAADAGAQDSSSLLNALWAVPFAEGRQGIVPVMLALGSDLVVAGTIPSGGLVLGGVDLSASDIFVARLDGATGSPVWIKGIGKAANATVTALAERANGGLLLTGSYSKAFTLGMANLPVPHDGGQGTFVAELDSDGNVLAAKGYGDPTHSNYALGVIGRTGGTDAENGSLLMLQFQGGLDLGQPIGAISPSTPTTPAICITTLAP
jgi:hypothetical protein